MAMYDQIALTYMSNSAPVIDNELIVQLILSGDPRGGEILYESYSRGLLFLAKRYCPHHADDCMHDAMVMALEQIRNGKLDCPAALSGYMVVIVKRAAWSKNSGSENREHNGETFENVIKTRVDDFACPERDLEVKRRSQLMRDGLKQLKPREQEVLNRFYLQGETQTQICAAMRLTESQFNFLKCRSNQRLQSFINRSTDIPIRRRLELLAV
jgi:RNA polymerase sigma factor (sigma-70 family)